MLHPSTIPREQDGENDEADSWDDWQISQRALGTYLAESVVSIAGAAVMGWASSPLWARGI